MFYCTGIKHVLSKDGALLLKNVLCIVSFGVNGKRCGGF